MIHERRVLVMMELDIFSWHHLLCIKYHLQFKRFPSKWSVYPYKTLKDVLSFDKH